MELRQIRYFVAVAELENFRRASEKLRIAQPALSRQINALEEDLQLLLFERLPRGVRLTPAGRHFLERGRRILSDLDATVTETRALSRGDSGRLRIGFIAVAAWTGPVPRYVDRFRQEVPGVGLELHESSTVTQLEKIRNGALDGGFLYNPPSRDPDFKSFFLENHGALLAVPKGSALANRDSVSMQDIRDHPLIWFHRAASPSFHDSLVDALSEFEIRPNIVHHAESEAEMMAMVNSGLGLALVNDRNIHRCPAGIVLLPVREIHVRLALHFVISGKTMTPQLQRLIEMIDADAAISGICSN